MAVECTDEEVQSSTVSIFHDSPQPLLAFQKAPDNAVARVPSLKVVNYLAVDVSAALAYIPAHRCSRNPYLTMLFVLVD